jgi:hypothetical protein
MGEVVENITKKPKIIKMMTGGINHQLRFCQR